jgi:hypothetical protein
MSAASESACIDSEAALPCLLGLADLLVSSKPDLAKSRNTGK